MHEASATRTSGTKFAEQGTGQVTSESLRYPVQKGRGAIT